MNELLTNYMKNVAELEVQSYTQWNIICGLKSRFEWIEYKRKIKEPQFEPGDGLGNIGIYILMALLLLGILLGDGLSQLLTENHLKGFRFLFSIIFILVIECIVIYICMFVGDTVKNIQGKKPYNEKLKIYNQEVEKNEQYELTKIPIKADLNNQLKDAEQAYQETKSVLNSLYDLNIIHPKYRSLVPVSSFYEYLDTGRCTQLEGHEGAYNIYETEIRLNHIVTRLDVIITKLDEIIENQYYIANELSKANNILRNIDNNNYKMLQSMERIEENTDLIEYNTHCTSVNSYITGSLVLYQTLKNEQF